MTKNASVAISVIGGCFAAVGVIWGFAGFYASQAWIVLGLTAIGAVLLFAGGRGLRRAGEADAVLQGRDYGAQRRRQHDDTDSAAQ